MNESYPDSEGKLVTVVEAGYYMNNIGVMELTLDADSKEIVSVDERFYTMENNIAENEQVKNSISEIEKQQQVTLSQTIGYTENACPYTWEDAVSYTHLDVYKRQIQYCANPVDLTYETLGIFVPAEYMNATDNGDGTFTCELNLDGKVGDYTAETAPIVIPVETPGYMAMEAPTDYVSGVKSYTDAGFIYVNAGCRGRNEGAPAAITDLKAAVRYLRYNGDNMAGSIDRIFTFGMSGGGAQSALMGATGNSDLYTPYLNAIGAVEGFSDAVEGSMCWCPITNLDYADEAYEWNMGITRTDLNDDMQELSDNMAKAFAEYINELGLKDEEGNILTLSESENGIYQSGSYYEYIKSEIERSLNNFLSDTTFPYTTGGSNTGLGEMCIRDRRGS